MSKPPLYSIVIPTRERSDVLASCLQTVANQTAANFEAIVMDNCSAPDTQETVESLDDSRFRYCRAPQRLSMSENWEMGLGYAKGDYVLFLGDDDGLLPDCVEISTRIHAKHPETALGWRTAIWFWPEVYPEEKQGYFKASFSTELEWREVDEWLGKVARYENIYSNLPGIYSSFVPQSVIQSVKARCGNYFASPVPDVWSGVINCLDIDRYLYLHRPLSFRAVSHHSTGHSQLYKESCSKAAHLFRRENRKRWDQQLDNRLVEGPIFEANMLIADTILKAMEYLPDGKSSMPFSFEAFANHLAKLPLLRYFGVYDEAVGVIRELAEKNGVAGDDLEIPERNAVQKRSDRHLAMRVMKKNGHHHVQMNTASHLIRNVADACVYLESLLPHSSQIQYEPRRRSR